MMSSSQPQPPQLPELLADIAEKQYSSIIQAIVNQGAPASPGRAAQNLFKYIGCQVGVKDLSHHEPMLLEVIDLADKIADLPNEDSKNPFFPKWTIVHPKKCRFLIF